MDKTTFRRVAEEFHALVELPAEQREAGLQALEVESTTLAQQVRALLRADDLDSPGVLDESLQAVAPELGAARLPSAGAEPGSHCGPWTLLQPLGEGGMGEVWLAERSEGGFAQRVALKLLKRGMDSAAILERFLQERRILARLRHPNIVHLIDGGMSEEGRPWFAMELVDGLGLHEHARRQALDPHARVALAARIADVIAYAHGELVVHRDLKPSNILVDAEGQPRLLDFGIAKLLADTGDPALTGTGMRLLSPAYAAPEQIRGQPVGTYTDIYALGVILYELLTGALPHKRSSNDLLVLARELERDQGTERLSRKLLGASCEQLERVYADAGAAQRFARQLDRDLSTVLARALQPDPQRRYASASAFAADLRAWLEGRPVSARPDSRAYRMRRFVTRNLGAVASAALILLSLSGGLAVALWQAEQARNQAELAQQQGERALRVKDFVITLFQETEGVGRPGGEQRTPLQLVEAGIERALEDLANDPLLQDEVLGDLLDIQVNLGAANAALPQLEQREAFRRSTFSEMDPRLAAALASRITALFQLGRFPDAEPLIDEALRILVAQHGEIHYSVAAMRNRMVRVRLAQTRFEEAAVLMQQVIATQEATLGPDSAEVGLSLSNLATVLMRLQRNDEAREALTRALANLERARGPEHASLTFPLVTLGDVERSDARFAEALPHYSRALELTRTHMGAGHPRTAVAYNRVGAIQSRLGQFAEAEASLRSALEIQEPQGYAELGDTYVRLGELAIARGEAVQSLDWFEKAFQFQLQTQGPANSATWRRRAEYCEVLQGLGRLQQAEACALETETALEALEARGLADLYAMRVLRAHGLLRAGQPQAAIAILEPGLAHLQEQLPTAHVLHALTQLELAAALERQRGDGDLERALALLDAAEPRIHSAGPRALAMLALTRLRLSDDADTRARQRPHAEDLASRAGLHRPWLESELAALR